jgi:hypothetical protein
VKRHEAPRRRLLGEGGRPIPEAEQEVAPAAEQAEPPPAVMPRGTQDCPTAALPRGPAHHVPDLTKLPAETKRRLDAEGVRRRGG